MSPAGRQDPLEAFVDVRCLCGRVHQITADSAHEGLSVGRWKCGTCERRFTLASSPGDDGREAFWPVFLDDIPSNGSTVQEGSDIDDVPATADPEHLRFQCRCGCRLIAKSRMYGYALSCPRCRARLRVKVGFEGERGKAVPLIEYPDEGRSSG